MAPMKEAESQSATLNYLIPTRAWIKVVVVEFEELHTERTFRCLVTAEVEYRHRYTETRNKKSSLEGF